MGRRLGVLQQVAREVTMRVRLGDLRRAIREEREYVQALNELFGKKPGLDELLKQVMEDLQATNKKIEQAHEVAPGGVAKAILAGLHSDLFNTMAEFRKHVAEVMKHAKAAPAGG